MACELIASRLAEEWELGVPKTNFVKVQRVHIPDNLSPHYFARPCIGSEFMQGVIDITPASYSRVPATKANLMMLMKIALFDFWVANEDRNANNANLMYDIPNDRLVPIDFGCSFNTATFEYPLSQLTSTDTILSADIFTHLVQSVKKDDLNSFLPSLKDYYQKCVARCNATIDNILGLLPTEWNIPSAIIREKLEELCTDEWKEAVWNNFVECLNGNTENE